MPERKAALSFVGKVKNCCTALAMLVKIRPNSTNHGTSHHSTRCQAAQGGIEKQEGRSRSHLLRVSEVELLMMLLLCVAPHLLLHLHLLHGDAGGAGIRLAD